MVNDSTQDKHFRYLMKPYRVDFSWRLEKCNIAISLMALKCLKLHHQNDRAKQVGRYRIYTIRLKVGSHHETVYIVGKHVK